MEFEIEICNWEIYNPTEFKKTPRWLRVNSELPQSESLFGLNFEEKWIWICLLCVACKKRSPAYTFDVNWFAYFSGSSPQVIENTIRTLQTRSCIRVISESAPSQLGKNSVYGRTDGRTYTPPSKPTEVGSGVPDLFSIWNENSGRLPKAKEFSRKRKTKWNARWEKKPDLEYWMAVIKRMANSPFCRGEKTGWKADIDFLLQEDAHLKVMEGKYDGDGPNGGDPLVLDFN